MVGASFVFLIWECVWCARAVDHLSQQVSQLEREKLELEAALAKLQQEHDQLLISTQNSVSFQFHTTAMLEVKRCERNKWPPLCSPRVVTQLGTPALPLPPL